MLLYALTILVERLPVIPGRGDRRENHSAVVRRLGGAYYGPNTGVGVAIREKQ
jgi:hypothetical protein